MGHIRLGTLPQSKKWREVIGLLAGLSRAIDQNTFAVGRSSDAGELAKASLLECLSVQLPDRLPTLSKPSSKGRPGIAQGIFIPIAYVKADEQTSWQSLWTT